jgi:hypothetical protein
MAQTANQQPASVLSRTATAQQRGVWELVLKAQPRTAVRSRTCDLRVTFQRPDGSAVAVDGFHDGEGVFRARAYCNAVGTWSWRTASRFTPLAGKTGSFTVQPSQLPGKLRIHPRDPHQFAYDNGDWFLHIGDTGYRYVTDTEPEWQTYVDQAVRMGATKIRTWFCRSRGDVEALLTDRREDLNLPYWQEIDRRLIYALEHHPQLQFQLIPYGEDTQELLRYAKGDLAAQAIARVAQARWSSFPNVTWCVSNDREIVPPATELKRRRVPSAVIDQIARDMADREPWGTLLTNHQSRWQGYDFANAPWSDIVTLEDLDQVDGRLILRYRALAQTPVVNDEDRYETYREPRHPRYFFRRLMWASLLSGGHATYGGLRTYLPYDGDTHGMYGYFDACAKGKLNDGAHDFPHIHAFFRQTKLTLAGWEPDDARVGNRPAEAKCCRKEGQFLVYLANPSGSKPETDDAAERPATCEIRLPDEACMVRWFDPRKGSFADEGEVAGPNALLTSPGPGDWIALIGPAQAQKQTAN